MNVHIKIPPSELQDSKIELSSVIKIYCPNMIGAAVGLVYSSCFDTNTDKASVFHLEEIRRCFDEIGAALESYEAAVAANAEDGT